MHDRVEAIGGNLKIDSKPGHGTRVVGSVHLPQAPSAASVAR
jgi:signal transduction histidine kinase